MQQIFIKVNPSSSLSWAWPSSVLACFLILSSIFWYCQAFYDIVQYWTILSSYCFHHHHHQHFYIDIHITCYMLLIIIWYLLSDSFHMIMVLKLATTCKKLLPFAFVVRLTLDFLTLPLFIIDWESHQPIFSLTLSRGVLSWRFRGWGKNTCATYFGHISVISYWIRVLSKANVKST